MANTKRRLSSLLLAFILVFSLSLSLAVPAFAASMSETITSGDKAFGKWRKMEDITVTTGSGLFYRWGWKKTTVTVQNTGSQVIHLYAVTSFGLIEVATIGRGQSVKMNLSGNGQTYQYVVQGSSYQNGNYGSFQVKTSAGSVS